MRQRNAIREKEEHVKSNRMLVRIYIDREANARLGRIAAVEERTQQRQMGRMLERLSAIYQECPQKLIDLGILSPGQFSQSAAA